MTRAPAVHRIGPYAATIHPQLAAVTVHLDTHTDGDTVTLWPRIIDATNPLGLPLNLTGHHLDTLAGLAWDIVESRTLAADRGHTYTVHIRPAVSVARCEGWDQ